MMNNKFALASLLLLGLAACGSDDEPSTPIDPTPPPVNPDSTAPTPDHPGWEDVNTGYIDLNGKSESTGKVNVFIGRRVDTVQMWQYACAIDGTGKPVMKTDESGKLTQLYPVDVDGNFDLRVAAQLNIDTELLTAEHKQQFFGTDCISKNDYIKIDGVDYPRMLMVRALALDANLPDEFFADFNDDNVTSYWDAAQHGIKTVEPTVENDYPTNFQVDLADVWNWLLNVGDDLGKGISRPDIFQAKHMSTFDLLRYVSSIRDDMEMTITAVPYNLEGNNFPLSDLYTYEYTISWDTNGDGIFSDEDNQFITNDAIDTKISAFENEYSRDYAAYYNSKRWHFVFNNSVGNDKGWRGSLNDHNYLHIDKFLIRDDQDIRFYPEYPGLKERREWLMSKDIERHINNGGKINVPVTESYPLDEDGRPFTYIENLFYLDVNSPEPVPVTYANHMKVMPGNMRSDIFKPGVITMMDIFLSANEHIDKDNGSFLVKDPKYPKFKFTFWPVLSSGAQVNQFGLEEAPLFGQAAGADSTRGIIWDFGNNLSRGEFGASVKDCRKFNIDGQQRSSSIPTELSVDDWLCILNFKNGSNGGYYISELLSAYVMPFGMEYFRVNNYPLGRDPGAILPQSRFADRPTDYDFNWYARRLADSSDYGQGTVAPDISTLRVLQVATVENPSGSTKILNEEHFGWEIADCTQCHNEDKDPKGHGGRNWPVNAADGFNETQPYYCATCHGSNGATKGHDAIGTCYWCHNSDNGLKNHREASSMKLMKESDWVANIIEGSTRPPQRYSNLSPYGEESIPVSSVYNTGKVFPDPYSCVTCHQAPE